MVRLDRRNIHFEVRQKAKSAYHCNRGDNIDRYPSYYPCFVLNFNDGWNDYTYKNWFGLIYFESENEYTNLGELKLMTTSGKVLETIPETFKSLDDTYCSVGLNGYYYQKLRNYFSTEDCLFILNILHDCALNVHTYEAFKESDEFKTSLYREEESKRAIREARFIIYDRSLSDAYTFEYNFHAPYSKIENHVTKWTVPFSYEPKPFQRVAGVIGENGTGKTEMFLDLIRELTGNESQGNFDKRPLFSSITAISTTPYDGYEEIESQRWEMPFVACSLEQNPDETIGKLTDGIGKVLDQGLFSGRSMLSIYEDFLAKLLGTEFFNTIFNLPNGTADLDPDEKPILDAERLSEEVPLLSSGQLHLLTLITHICANVHYDSLFLIDEPEVHLHPHAIMQFFYQLEKLLRRFQSYAVIATHSPLVIREIPGSLVSVIRRMEGDVALVQNIGIETFGEDVSLLYREIFNYDESESCFRLTVKKMAKSKKKFEYILSALSSEENPLSLNARFTIRNILTEIEHEEN